jgi:hypothetical protein
MISSFYFYLFIYVSFWPCGGVRVTPKAFEGSFGDHHYALWGWLNYLHWPWGWLSHPSHPYLFFIIFLVFIFYFNFKVILFLVF